MIDLSILIVTWNNENEIEACIKSIITTIKEHSFEIIICDNLSNDATLKLAHKFKEVCILKNKENLGFAKGNNIALQQAVGEYILFLNPDTIMQINTMDLLLNFYSEHKEYGAVTCRLLNADGTNQASIYKLPSKLGIIIENLNLQNIFPSMIGRYFGYSMEYSHDIECCMGAFILMRKEYSLTIGGFTERYFMYMEDGDLCYKIKKQLNRSIYYRHDVTCIHLGGCSERQDVEVPKIKKMLDSINIFLGLYKENEKKQYFRLYRIIYRLKGAIAKIIMNSTRYKKYKCIANNCREAIDYIGILMKEDKK